MSANATHDNPTNEKNEAETSGAQAQKQNYDEGRQQGRNLRRNNNRNRGRNPPRYKYIYVKKGEGDAAGEQEGDQEKETQGRRTGGEVNEGEKRQSKRNRRKNREGNNSERRVNDREGEKPTHEKGNDHGNGNKQRKNKPRQENQEEEHYEEKESGKKPKSTGPPKKINSKYLSINRFTDTADCHRAILKNLANYRDKVEVFGSGVRIEDLLSLHLEYSEFYKLARLSKAGRARLRLTFERQDNFFEVLKSKNVFAELFASEKPLRYSENFHNKEESHFLGKKVRLAVFKGSLLSENTDAIVNYTDRELNHGFGLAHEVYNAAGEHAFQEGLELLKKREKVEGGDAVAASNGNIGNLKKIIHVVVPDWSVTEDGPNVGAKLTNMINNILGEAEAHHLNSVSLSIICSGDDKLPEQHSAELTVSAIDSHFKARGNSSIGHVRLTSSHQNIINALGDALNNLNVVEEKQEMKEEVYVPPSEEKHE